jgi:hypothetical protein
LAGLENSKNETNLFTYPISVGDKTYSITLEADWNKENPPTVHLSNLTKHAVQLHFLGDTKKTVAYKITIPTELIDGNISLIWKYYQQNPDRYTLSSNSTHNSLQMTFDYDPHFSGMGYFEILGTEGAE